ncbi:MAG: FeoA family protein [Candidatus Bipolaricaulota bacterium]|nr:ferrous iron transport protein A [Candidatus Bipolaricaulota bacterium]MBS3791363.1 ferrous iron transport protein A [Candidatus Bipolaricaulota bacterium]
MTDTKKLSELDYGEKGVIKKINRSLKDQLLGRGIREGKTIRMDTKQPINGPVVITIDRSTTSLGLNLAKDIFVEVNNGDTSNGSS